MPEKSKQVPGRLRALIKRLLAQGMSPREIYQEITEGWRKYSSIWGSAYIAPEDVSTAIMQETATFTSTMPKADAQTLLKEAYELYSPPEAAKKGKTAASYLSAAEEFELGIDWSDPEVVRNTIAANLRALRLQWKITPQYEEDILADLDASIESGTFEGAQTIEDWGEMGSMADPKYGSGYLTGLYTQLKKAAESRVARTGTIQGQLDVATEDLQAAGRAGNYDKYMEAYKDYTEARERVEKQVRGFQLGAKRHEEEMTAQIFDFAREQQLLGEKEGAQLYTGEAQFSRSYREQAARKQAERKYWERVVRGRLEQVGYTPEKHFEERLAPMSPNERRFFAPQVGAMYSEVAEARERWIQGLVDYETNLKQVPHSERDITSEMFTGDPSKGTMGFNPRFLMGKVDDPLKTYLRDYPFQAKYLAEPPRSRGFFPGLYAPPAVWRT